MAREFDGIDDSFIAPSSASLESCSSAITLAYWWSPTVAGSSFMRHIVKYGIAETSADATFAVHQNTSTADTRYQGLLTGTTWTTGTNNAHTIGQWQFHVLFWESGTAPTLRRYATDGTLLQSGVSGTARTGTLPNGTGRMFLGRQASENYVAGRMARVFLHNARLSDADILTLHGGSLPVTPSGDYWPLDGTGTTETGTVNGNVFTATGAPGTVAETGLPVPPAQGKTLEWHNGTAWETRKLLVRNDTNTDWVWQ